MGAFEKEVYLMGMKKGDITGFSGYPWPQYQDELQSFIQLLKDEGCNSYLEIGARHGDTFHAVGMALPEGSKLVAVDQPGTRSGRKKGGTRFADSDMYLKVAIEDLCKHRRDAYMIIGDSHEKKTIAKVKALAPFDAVFIDGDHTEHGVRLDFQNYGPMVRIVAFHDICGQGKNTRKLGPLFETFIGDKRSVKFVKNGLTRGIGVIWR